MPDLPSFVVQEHHARRLHWDFRLERDGVLVSWALPKGVPDDPKRNGLAVHVDDHELSYGSWEGVIPDAQYGSGRVTIWDRGTYETEEWADGKVKVVLHGERVQGRYVLFRTRGDDWMIHRMSPPADRTAEPLPDLLRPMLAKPGRLPPPPDDAGWAYEMKWDGVRLVAYVDRGSLRLVTRNDREVTSSYPELRGLVEALGEHRTVLDGEVVAFDEARRPSFGVLQQRMHVQRPGVELRAAVPVTYLVFDVLHLDGHPQTGLPYEERRGLLEGLGLSDGAAWDVPPHFAGSGSEAVAASKAAGLEGVLAKRLGSVYRPGHRSPDWVKVKHARSQDVLVVGWTPGTGRRDGQVGALLLGVPDGNGELAYAGKVGTGFTDATLRQLASALRPLERKTAPVEVPRIDARAATWVTPKLVGEVVFSEWTREGKLRHPSWRGLRPDRSPSDVVRDS